jgi:hypothetical protein
MLQVMFDPKTFKTPINVLNDDYGFPEKLYAADGTNRSWGVSPGGFIQTQDIHDAFLLAQDGITCVEYVPALTPAFEAAARDPSPEFIQMLQALEYMSDQSLCITTRAPYLDIPMESDVLRPYLIDRLYNSHFARAFVNAFASYINNSWGVGDETVYTDAPVPYYHVDRMYKARALFNSAGKTTVRYDGRISAEIALKLVRDRELDKRERLHISDELRSDYLDSRAALGGALFLKGSGVLGDDFSADDIIRNLCVHSSDFDFSKKDQRFYRDIG